MSTPRLLEDLLSALDASLGLAGRAAAFTRATPLLNALPELDSMGIVALVSALEEQFGIRISDDDFDANTFATVGALCDFVAAKTRE